MKCPEGSVIPDDHSDWETEGYSTQELSDAYLRYANTDITSSSPIATLLSRPPERDPVNDEASIAQETDIDSVSSSDSSVVDIFGLATDPANGLIPLVDCWLDIEKHLTEETIPSPDELEKEAEEIVECVCSFTPCNSRRC